MQFKHQVEDVMKLPNERRYYVVDIIENDNGRNYYFCIGVTKDIELDFNDVVFFEIEQNDQKEETVRLVDNKSDNFKHLALIELADVTLEIIPEAEEKLKSLIN